MNKDDLFNGMVVVAKKDSDYEGLVGHIQTIRTDKNEFETENDTELEIVCDLYETNDMSMTHGHLNGTSICQLIMGEDELIFFKDDIHDIGYDWENKSYQFSDVIYTCNEYRKKIINSL